MTHSDLTKSCTFLKLTLSRLGDKRGVSSDAVVVDADKDRIKIRKVIFKSAHFNAIKQLDSEIRRYVRDVCLPFEPGLHLTPLKLVEPVNLRLSDYSLRRQGLVASFAKVWPLLSGESKTELRVLFDEEDYDDSVESSFFMAWQFLTFSAPTELQEISPEIFKAEREKIVHRMEEAFEQARYVLRETMLELVGHLRERLEPEDSYGSPKRLSASTLSHLQEFLQTFNLRDITNDYELQQYTKEARRILNGVDIEALRTTDGLRARVRSELSKIETHIDSSLQVAPKRRIRS